MFSFLKICKELSGSITEEWASHPESSDNFPNANSTVGFVAAENDNAISASSRFIIFVFDFNASCLTFNTASIAAGEISFIWSSIPASSFNALIITAAGA